MKKFSVYQITGIFNAEGNLLHIQSVVCCRQKVTQKNAISADFCYLRARYGARPQHTANMQIIVMLINLRFVKNTKPH